MGDTKLTDLTALSSLADADWVYVVDVSDTTDDSAGSSRKITRANLFPSVVTDHIRAGHTQLYAGNTEQADIYLHNVIAEDAWESVGPTDSGADNIWATMDQIPSNATILICRLEIAESPSGTASAYTHVYATQGDIASPTRSSKINRIGHFKVDPDADTGTFSVETEVQIPLGPTNQDFKAYWESINGDASLVILSYKGFITD